MWNSNLCPFALHSFVPKKNLYIRKDIENVNQINFENDPSGIHFPQPNTSGCSHTHALWMCQWSWWIIVYFDTLSVDLSTWFIELGQKSLFWVSQHSTVVFCSLRSNGYINPGHLFHFYSNIAQPFIFKIPNTSLIIQHILLMIYIWIIWMFKHL